MSSNFTIVIVTAVITATITFISTVFLENRRNSIKHAREVNPNYFRQLHRRTVLVREALQGFGSVWDRFQNENDTLTHDLYRILVAKVEDLNRELSVSTNEDIFLLPAQLQTLCEDVRRIMNDAVYETDITIRTKLVLEEVSGNRIELEDLSWSAANIENLRFFETRRQSSLRNSPFCNQKFRSGLITLLKNIEGRIKRLAVN